MRQHLFQGYEPVFSDSLAPYSSGSGENLEVTFILNRFESLSVPKTSFSRGPSGPGFFGIFLTPPAG